jgi:hypothetical protein
MKSGETITITKLPGLIDQYEISNSETNEHDIGGGAMAAAKLALLASRLLGPVLRRPGLGGYQLVYDHIRRNHPELPKLLVEEDEAF